MNDSPTNRRAGDAGRLILESITVVPWCLDWRTSSFTFVGPQIEQLLGWPPSTWRTVRDWHDRIHCDDRDRVSEFCRRQSAAGIDHEADYRALTSRGDYRWVRDIVQVVRNQHGDVDHLSGFKLEQSAAGRGRACAMDAFARELSLLGARCRLTPAEQRVVGFLVQGYPAKRIAQIGGVAVPTVRAQIQSAFRKTGTQRQVELVRLLLSPPPDAGRSATR